MTAVLAAYHGYALTGPDQPLSEVARDLAPLAPGDVLVRVAGCGVCHTDLGYAHGGVRTRHPLPLVLGHEISGFVEEAGDAVSHLAGCAVVVPAVLPCGECRTCREGHPNVCPKQVMPGNDRDGGFASHVVVPGRFVCAVPGASPDADAPLGSAPGLTLRHMAVVADAVSTAYQAVQRSQLRRGDLAVVAGLGGVGGFVAQIARERGATVVGLDVDAEALASAAALGVSLALDPRTGSPRDLRKKVLAFASERELPDTSWKIFECSGTGAGQTTAFGLLVPDATLVVVGYTLQEVPLRLSNLMAFDARAIGNWGCAPELFPAVVRMVLEGRIEVVSRCELRPLEAIAGTFDDLRNHRTRKRVVLVP